MKKSSSMVHRLRFLLNNHLMLRDDFQEALLLEKL